jgi:hypothetical protein
MVLSRKRVPFPKNEPNVNIFLLIGDGLPSSSSLTWKSKKIIRNCFKFLFLVIKVPPIKNHSFIHSFIEQGEKLPKGNSLYMMMRKWEALQEVTSYTRKGENQGHY